MEKKRLSAGLQSFLAWHNLCLVMTVYSLLTLTESLARINCVHDFSPCVLTLRNKCKLQHLLWSNSIFSSGSHGSFPAQNPRPASSKYQSDQRDYQINATLRNFACMQITWAEWVSIVHMEQWTLSSVWQDNCQPYFRPRGTFSHISDDCLPAMHFHWWISNVMASK